MPSRTVDRKCDYLMMRWYAVEAWSKRRGIVMYLVISKVLLQASTGVVAKSLLLYECTSST